MTKPCLLALGLTLLGSAFDQAAAANEPVRLAIIAENPELAPAADLLTVEFSHQAGVVLLERAQIDRVLHEQALTTSQSQDYSWLGKLLGADGVVTLGLRTVKGAPVQETRVIAVNPGVVVAASYQAYPATNLDGWAGLTRERVSALIPKLGVAAGMAIPVSVLNLRAVLPASEGSDFEKELTWLLIHRLANEPRVFLLEREKLEELDFEKQMAGASPSNFWSSRFVVNGNIAERPGNSLAVTLYLEHPGQPAQTVRSDGRLSDLPGLAESLAGELLRKLGQPGVTAAWQPVAEGRRFFEEAESASQAGLTDQSLASAEASEVLGFHSDLQQGLLTSLYSLKAFAGASSPILLSDHPPVDSFPASSVDLASALRGMEHFVALLKSGQLARLPRNVNVPELGASILLNASRVIRWHLDNHDYANHRDNLELLRSRIRETVALPALYGSNRPSLDIPCVIAGYAPYWYDDPADVLAVYDKMLAFRFGGYTYDISRLRHYLAQCRDKPSFFGTNSLEFRTPWLVDWKGAGKEQLDQIWSAFVERKLQSPELEERLDGRLLAFYSASSEADQTRIVDKTVSDLWLSRANVATNAVTYAITTEFQEDLPLRPHFRLELFNYLLNAGPYSDFQLFEICPLACVTNQTEAATLWRSLQEYEKRLWPDGPRSQADLNGFKEFRSYRDHFLLAFPEFREPAAPGLAVVQCWPPLASKPAPLMPNSLPREVTYATGGVWVSADRFEPDFSHYQTVFTRVELPDFKTSELKAPFTCLRPSSGSLNDFRHAFAVNEKWLFWVQDGRLERCNLATAKWDETQVPSNRFPLLKLVGGSLYYAFPGNSRGWANYPAESGILRIDQETLQGTVLASSRRKPALSPLDDATPYSIEDLFTGPSNQLHAVIEIPRTVLLPGQRPGELWEYSELEGKWRPAHPEITRRLEGARAIPYTGGNVLQPVGGTSDNTFFLHQDGTLGFMFPGTNGFPDTPVFHNLVVRQASPTEIWQFTSWNPVMFSTDGNDLWVLGPRRGTDTAPLNLHVFAKMASVPKVIPLQFPNADTTRYYTSDTNIQGRVGMLQTPAGLIVFNTGDTAFWFVPREQVNAALAAAAPAAMRENSSPSNK